MVKVWDWNFWGNVDINIVFPAENSFFEPSQEKCVNDEMQAGACVELAKRNYFKALGLEKDPPKSSVAYDKARAYLQEKNKQSTQKG